MNNLVVPGFSQEVRKYGRFDVNACMNCGSCTVVCDLSNGHASFPRRPIQHTIFGLKNLLTQSLEPWLCYDCGDCSTTCPRQAEPRESMMTLRRYLAAVYDVTGLGSKIFRSRAWHLGSIFFVGILVLGLALFYHTEYVEMAIPDLIATPMGLEHMFPMIEVFTEVVYVIPVFLLIAATYRMFRFTMGKNAGFRIPLRFYLIEAKTMAIHMLSQRNMKSCPDGSGTHRWITHMVLVFGFVLMSVILFFFLDWFQTDSLHPVYHPQRWSGYLITAVMIYVPVEILIGRIKKRKSIHKFSELSDLTLPVLLFLTALSGIAVHILRYMELALACHLAYALHLAIAVPLVVIEIPFGKLSHAIYRPLAIYFHAVRVRALAEEEPQAEPEPKEAAAA